MVILRFGALISVLFCLAVILTSGAQLKGQETSNFELRLWPGLNDSVFPLPLPWLAADSPARGSKPTPVFTASELASEEYEVTYEGSFLWNDMRAVAYEDGYAYCAMGSGLLVLDVSDPTSPTPASRVYFHDAKGSTGIAVKDGKAYVTVWGGRLYIIDVGNPLDPSILSILVTPECCNDGVVVYGNYAYVGSKLELVVVNVADPRAPTVENVIELMMSPTGMVVWEDHLYLAAGYAVEILSLVDPSDPSPVATLGPPQGTSLTRIVYDVTVCEGTLLFVEIRGFESYDSYFWLADITDPSSPIISDSLGGISGAFLNLATSPGYAYASGDEGVLVFEITGPENLELMSQYPSPGFGQGMAATEDFLYLTVYDYQGWLYFTIDTLCDSCFCGGAQDSTVYGGDFQVIDVSDKSAPCAAGRLPQLLLVEEVALGDGFAYVVGSGTTPRLAIVDTRTPDTLMLHGSVLLEHLGDDICVAADMLYIAVQNGDILTFNLADAGQPELVSVLPLSRACDVKIQGDFLFVATYSAGLLVVDVSDPASPEQVSQYLTGSRVWEVVPKGNLAYVACHDEGLQILDISDIYNPTMVGWYRAENFVRDVDVFDDIAYILDYDTLISLNISNPEEMNTLDRMSVGSGWGQDVEMIWDDSIAVVCGFSGGGVAFVDISDPLNLTIAGAFEEPATKAAVDDEYLWLAAGHSLLRLRLPLSTEVADSEELVEIPQTMILHAAYPNPFNLGTNIPVDLPAKGEISITVHNILGQKIRTIYEGLCPAGCHSFTWDGRGENGRTCPSGVYFARLRTAEGESGTKMVLIK